MSPLCLPGWPVGWLCVRPSITRSSHAPFVSRVLSAAPRPSRHTAYPNYFFFQIIGPGGKIIRQIIDDFSLDSMDVEEDGRVMISSFNSTSAARREVTPRLCDCLRRVMDLPTFVSFSLFELANLSTRRISGSANARTPYCHDRPMNANDGLTAPPRRTLEFRAHPTHPWFFGLHTPAFHRLLHRHSRLNLI